MQVVFSRAQELRETVAAIGMSLMVNQPVEVCREILKKESLRTAELAKYEAELRAEKAIWQTGTHREF